MSKCRARQTATSYETARLTRFVIVDPFTSLLPEVTTESDYAAGELSQ